MAKLIPAKHLLLIGIVFAFLTIVFFAFPSSATKDKQNIALEITPQVIKESELSLFDSNLPPPNQASSQTVDNNPQVQLSSVPQANRLEDQLAAPPRPKFTLEKHSVQIKEGDSLSKVLSRYQVSANDIYKVSNADKKQKSLLRMRPGQHLEFSIKQPSGTLQDITLVINRLQSIHFKRSESQFDRAEINRTPDISQTYKEAVIHNSLFVDGMNAKIDQPLLIELANIFGWDIDFALDIRKGDRFSLLYEEKSLDGEKIGNGNILAAQFINNGRTFQAIRYETKKGANYYTPDGLAMRKAFIRTPVDFTRISSKFNPNRLHPIFKTSRPHRGVDYAAASGTPVKAAGDGKVSFAGKQNGYGNVVIINHGKGYQTLYAHLRGFARGMRKGKRVKQGNVIAYVGQTGWATGPHLHYEFRVNGVHKNPVTVKLPNDDPMPKAELKKYLPYAQNVIAALTNSNSAEFSQRLALLKD
ncbi:M23 family metallopeptidase [Marinomonas pollencensis]|uniref:Murein DD-endopeptidase MepM/ murein hydrolase activator NlpD n=1 Tax=Marinomonas pollencensis TaxID=491954 RepID=A0A3E0DML1_9GAMM|nr:peptidoglycan DD-metalloendopeptidase family protein [Marinomonas pollencensis]REG83030.1 murein DD-endopeptidase MepM/ murein hydrolase activator NlpD [Marinomonas pollencensis]